MIGSVDRMASASRSKSRRRRAALAAGAGCLAMWIPAAAWAVAPAADTEQAAAGTPAPSSASADQAPAAAQPDSSLADIVVTARRREEVLQRVPVSIASLNGAELQVRSVANMVQAAQFIPNVVAAGGGTGPSFGTYSIRGIGSVRSAIEDEAPVALYIDGVFQGFADGALLDVIEPKRIEVLRGPQGTLFGKNALGGAIQYVTQEPLDHFDGQLKATYGSYNRISVSGYADLPLSDTLFTRITAASITRDGTVKSLYNGNDVNNLNTRFLGADLLWKPAPNFTLRIQGDYTIYDTRGDGNVIIGVQSTDPNVKKYAALGLNLANYVAPDPWENYSNSNPYRKQRVGGVAATADYALTDWLDIKSISSYRQNRFNNEIDRDGTPYTYFEQVEQRRHKQYSEELQAIGTTSKLKWIVGLYYYHITPNDTRTRLEGIDVPGTLPIHEHVDIRSTSKAAFGEATYTFNDIFSLTAGGRYTSESKYTLSTTDLGKPTQPLTVGSNKGNFHNFSPRVVGQAQWTSNFMTYLSYSKGFRSGGFNDRYDVTLPNNGFVAYQPETLTNYEAGMRTDLLDRHLRVNLTYFHANYNDLQLTSTFPNTTTTFTQNVGKAKLDGVELESAAVFSSAFRLNFGGSYLDARYTDIGTAQGITLKSPLPRAPKWSYTIGAQYDLHMADGGDMMVRGDYGYKSRQQEASTDAGTIPQPGYALLNLRAQYTLPSGKWSVAVYATNVTNKAYLVVGNIQRGILQAVYGDPREIGGTVTMHFGGK